MVKFADVASSQMVDEVTGKDMMKLVKGIHFNTNHIRFSTYSFQGEEQNSIVIYDKDGIVYTTGSEVVINQIKNLLKNIDEGKEDALSYIVKGDGIHLTPNLEGSIKSKRTNIGEYLYIE